MSKMTIFLIYWILCAVYAHINFSLKIKLRDVLVDEEFERDLKQVHNLIGIEEEKILNIVHLLLILFSWLLVPMKIIKKIFNVQV